MTHHAAAHRLKALALACVCAAICGCRSARDTTGDPTAARTTVPDVAIPDDVALAEQLTEAVELGRRDAFDRLHDAVDPGELIEHATVTQDTLEQRALGPDALFVFGDELFDYEFRLHNGLGNGLSPHTTGSGPKPVPNFRVVHKERFGGPDSHNCASCHSKGGLDGAGTATQNAFLAGNGANIRSASVRNPPHVLGLGPIEALAAEMTAELHAQIVEARTRATADSAVVTVALESKGVRFGSARVKPGPGPVAAAQTNPESSSGTGAPALGDIDTTGVRGVDPDLVIRPFGWKGEHATIRAISEDSFRIHMGVLSQAVQERAQAGQLSAAEKAVFGDGPWYDIDRDSVMLEIEDGMITSIAAYLAQLEVPVMIPPRAPRHVAAFARGSELFDAVGCNDCHRRELLLTKPVIEIVPTQPSHKDRPPVRIHVVRDGEHPKVEAVYADGSQYRVALFSDLARHDMGPDLAQPGASGKVPPRMWLTRPLWGLADTAPYLHDGRAPTVHDAIRLHGGEAAQSRDAYLALTEPDRGALRVFLLSLTRNPRLLVP